METQTNPEKSSSSELDELIQQLSVDQRRYIVARMEQPRKDKAAKSIGIQPDTVYHWPPEVERAIELIAENAVQGALSIRRATLVKAMAVKARALDSKDERIAQSAASELIEWELGKAVQKQEHSGENGGPIEHVIRIIDSSEDDKGA